MYMGRGRMVSVGGLGGGGGGERVRRGEERRGESEGEMKGRREGSRKVGWEGGREGGRERVGEGRGKGEGGGREGGRANEETYRTCVEMMEDRHTSRQAALSLASLPSLPTHHISQVWQLSNGK